MHPRARLVALLFVILGQGGVRGARVAFRVQGAFEPADSFRGPSDPQGDDARLVPSRSLVRLARDGSGQLIEALKIVSELVQACGELPRLR